MGFALAPDIEASVAALSGTNLKTDDVTVLPRGSERSRVRADSVKELLNTIPGTAIFRYVHRSDGTNVWEYLSEGFEALTGYPARLLLEDSRAIYSLIYDDDAPKLRDAHVRAIQNRDAFVETVRVKHKDGGVRWICCRSQPNVRPDNSVVWHGTFIDETPLHTALNARLRAEEALKASEEQLSLALDASEAGVWDWNPQTREGTLSPRIFQMAGYEISTVGSPMASFISLIHPDDLQRGEELRSEHYQGHASAIDYTYRVRHREGHWIHVRSRAKVVARDEQGLPIRVVGTLTDITLQKNLEAKLEQLAMVARETTNAVAIADANGKIQWVNDSAARMMDTTVEQLLGQTYAELGAAFFPDEERRAFLSGLMAKRERFTGEGWLRTYLGRRICVSFEVKPIFNERDEIEVFISVAQDVTANTLADQQLRASEEHLREAQEVGRLGSWRFVIATGKVYWSEQLCIMMGRRPEDSQLTPDDYLARISPKDVKMLREKIATAIRDGIGYETRHRATRFDGSERHFNARCKTRRDATGRVVELYGTCQDITEQVRAERENLEMQERLASTQRYESLGLLAGGIAHDFNNLLMGVLMEASLLSQQVDTHTPIAEGLENIQESAKRMADLTSQLLSYAGRGQFVVEKLDPNIIVADMLKLLERNVGAHTLIESDIMRDRATLEINAGQLRQVIMNLVLNASEALGDSPGQVIVRTRVERCAAAPLCWVLEVSDTGVGMMDAVRRRIFDPFYSTKKGGRGLGLSTVHGIVQRCKGIIDVKSVLGQGSTFSVRLPAIEYLEPERTSNVSAKRTAASLRVLIADDEAMVRRSLRRMLELQQAIVVEAADGVAAIEALANTPTGFDLVLLDVIMPRKNGYEVLAEIRAHSAAVKVVLMSGYNDPTPNDNTPVDHLQPDAIMQKPFGWNELERVIASVQEGKSAAPSP